MALTDELLVDVVDFVIVSESVYIGTPVCIVIGILNKLQQLGSSLS